jgi:L-ectoine synthase
MIIRSLAEIEGTERDVAWGNGQSRRLLLARDGMGYSVTDTVIDANTSSVLEYKRHLEACYCIEGEGEVEDMQGNVFPIKPGTIYALDKHDKHVLRAITRMRLVCVFLPALEGSESHKLAKAGDSSSY